MAEELPFITIQSEDGEFNLTPENSRLFTFVGKTLLANGDYSQNADRNHVYYYNSGRETGTYIFGKENVQRLGAVMLSNHFPADLYRRSVPEGDEEAYQKYLKQNETTDDLGDYIPDGWGE